MPRALVLSLNGEASTLPLSRIDREKLYGKKVRMVTDENGDRCSMAYLSSDGKCLVPAGGFSTMYVDEAGNSIERSELQTIDEDGEVIDKLPSTLGADCELYGPVPATRVLDHITTSVYHLDASEISADLSTSLDNGDIYETEFRYMASTSTNTLFLLRNDEGTFALICQPAEFTMVQKESEENPDLEDEEDDDDDDLDFSF